MKRRILLTLFATVLCVSGVYAQKTVQIEGTTFTVRCNDDDMTVEICDYDYRIDDHKFPMYKDKRRTKHKLNNKTLTIPQTVVVDGSEYVVTSIGRAAFADYCNFKSVNIPSTVTNIGEYAFFRTPLVEVEIPAAIVSIGDRAFGHCPKLKKIRLPYSGITMGNDVYAESKDIAVTIQPGGQPLWAANQATTANNPSPKAQKKKPAAMPTSVDVDVNIPAASKKNENTFVVVIANENYSGEAKVHYAINDGRIFKEYCTNTLGVPEANIHIVEDATLNNMRNEINWLGRIASVYEGDARIIVYYAGHGIPNEATGSAYLLPVDGVGTDVQTGYSLKSFYAELGKMSSQSVTVFMDACFSGSQRGEGMLASSRGVAIAAKEEVPTGNLVVFSATQKDETAFPYDEKGHGLFTYFLLKKLQETKGDVTYEELGTYLKKQVSRHAIVVNNKPQTPSMSSSGSMSGKIKSMKLK